MPIGNSQRRLSVGGRSLANRGFFWERYGGVILLLLVMATCGSVHAESGVLCTPSFPFRDGWWGADAAYSVPLPDGRDVWIFGDTLYGEKRVVEDNQPRMVRNSIGISRCNQDEWHLDYVIRQSAGGPADFFQSQRKGTWYWALDGFVHGNDLWVTLLCMRNARMKRRDGFDFETCGADLAKVSDLGVDPQKWKVAYFPLVKDGVRAYPSASAVVDGGYVYLFALYEKGTRPLLVTRIALTRLDAPARNLQYLSKAGTWKPGLTPGDAMPVMKSGSSELSLRYHPDLKQWLAVMRSPEISSDAILMRRASDMTGPWGEEKAIYQIPEMQKGSVGYDKNVICYAAKEHPEFEQAGSLLITYVCNTTKVSDLVTHLNIYVPKVVQLPLAAQK